MKHFGRRGFTLVELLVVIIIIGILAAVAIPQFGGSTREAKEATLRADLRSLRGAIDLFYNQHSVYPGTIKTHRATAAGAAAAHADAEGAFIKQLTVYSDQLGNTCDEKSASFPSSPDMRTSTATRCASSAACDAVFPPQSHLKIPKTNNIPKTKTH